MEKKLDGEYNGHAYVDMSLSVMRATCNVRASSFLENYISPAISGGYLERKYPNSPNHPKRQYRLTDKGLTLKDKD